MSGRDEDRGFLPFHRPDIGEAEIAAVVAVLRSGWLTYGPKVREFGEACARWLDVAHAVPVASCSAGLFLGLKALGIGPGDRVALPALTFTSTLAAVLHCGAEPIPVDIETGTLGLDPERLVEALGGRTRCVLPVHYGGHPCRVREIVDLARARGARVVEDAAHAFGAEVEGRRLGSCGDLTVFSFYATKNITTGDGGLVTTTEATLARRIERLSLHGLDGDAWQRYRERGRWYYEVVEPGWKLHLGDPAAALGLAQLARADAFQARRTAIARRYDEAFADAPGLTLPPRQPWARHAWHLYALQVDPDRVDGGRDGLIADLTAAGVGTSVHFIPLHHHPAYRVLLGPWADRLPRTDEFYRRCVSLPIYPAMSDDDVERVVAAVGDCLGRRAR